MVAVSEPAAATDSAFSAWYALVALTVGLAAAWPAQSMGLESRHVNLEGFDRVHVSGAGTVHLIQRGPSGLELRGRPEVLQAVKVQVRDGALYIVTPSEAGNLLMELRVGQLTELVSEGNARITGDDLSFDALRLDGAGAGSFRMWRLQARELEVRSRGATGFDLTGQVDEQVVELSGTSAYHAGELVSETATVDVAGASDVRLWADELLNVRVAGTADIRYTGSARVEQRISGDASVLRIPQIAI